MTNLRARSAPAAKAHPTMGEYELRSVVSSGGSGKVYRAKNSLMGRDVLLKTMPDAAKTHPEVLKRFQREIRVATQLSHPNLIAAYHAGSQDGVYYLVMEDVEGTDLRTLVKQQGPLPLDKAVDYVCQAAIGLQHMHDQGVFHRNVKPANLMLDTQDTVRVTNLTSALVDVDSEIDSAGTEGLTRQGQFIGTADYVAPEQAFDAHNADHRSDIYSLGCTLYYLLAGKQPYPGTDPKKKVMAQMKQPTPSLKSERREVSDKLDQVYQQMMAKRPEDRLQSMGAVVHGLRAAFYSGGDSVARPHESRWALVVAGVIGGAIFAGLIGALWSLLASVTGG